jgi:phosphatidylserine decarboxylase
MKVKKILGNCFTFCIEWYNNFKTGNIGHITIVRRTGEMKRERMTIKEFIKNNIFFSKPVHFLDRTGYFRKFLSLDAISAGHKMRDPKSKKYIPNFIKYFDINMEDFEPSDYKEYENFNDFFTRKLSSNSRPISHINNSKIAVSAADCRLTVFDNIEESKKLWIKGKNFTLDKLIQDENLANEFIGGSIASFRLSPQDYHHYHSPIDGIVEYWKSIPGTYFGVNPFIINSDLDILDMNARSIVVIRNPIWGKILYIPIGAELVGSVQITDNVKNKGKIKKGEEIGMFSYGGSNVIIVFEKGKMKWDDDIEKNSKNLIETDILVGETIGRLYQ